MKINIVMLWTGIIVDSIENLNKEQCDSIIRFTEKHKSKLPKTYNRHKQSRKHCRNVDLKFSKQFNVENFFVSMYSGRQYGFEIGED